MSVELALALRLRLVIKAGQMDGFSADEVAQALGTTVAAVHSALQRAGSRWEQEENFLVREC